MKKIILEDCYLDYTYSNTLNLERRFFVNIELENNQFLVFMNEQNSVFTKYGLRNTFSIEELDFERKNENEQESNYKTYYQDFEIDFLRNDITEEITKRINFSTENWIEFVRKRSLKNNQKLNNEIEEKYIQLFQNVNEEIKKFWLNIEDRKKGIIFDDNNAEEVKEFEEFFQYVQTIKSYKELTAKLSNQNNSKSMKI